MWRDGVTWFLGLLAIAVSAGWIASRRTKTLGRLKGEAELLANMPESPARVALQEHIEGSVLEYLRVREERERLETRWMMATALQVLGVAMLTIAQITGAGLNSDWGEATVWSVAVFVAGVVVLVPAMAWELWVLIRQRQVAREIMDR